MKNTTPKTKSNGFFKLVGTSLQLLLITAVHAESVNHTWIGSAEGSWRDVVNWDSGVIPSNSNANVFIDSNPEQDSIVTLAPAQTRWTNGVVTIDAGDTLRVSKALVNSAQTELGGLINNGTVNVIPHASNNDQNTGVALWGTAPFTNSADATVNINGAVSGRNRVEAFLKIGAQNTNDGKITAQQPAADRNQARFELNAPGTFTNNGLIHIRAYSANASINATSFAQLRLNFPDTTNPSLTFEGSGRILLDMEDLYFRKDGVANILANSAKHYVTNGINHTIEGNGRIDGNIVNQGLIRGLGTNGYLNIRALGVEKYGRPFINTENGRIVSAGPCGMIINHRDAIATSFQNYGHLEARADSFISFSKYITASSSKWVSTTQILNGTIAGGGKIINNYRPIQLSNTCTLMPGDLENTDGTGLSTLGCLTFTTNLILNAETKLNFQLGKSITPGTTYDCVNVTGALTLAGVLNIEGYKNIEPNGTYTIMTCTPDSLTDNGLTLGTIEDGLQTPQLTVDPALGIVTLTFPPTGTAIFIR